MKKLARIFDPFTMQLNAGDPTLLEIFARGINTAGLRGVDGTALTGTIDGTKKIFTRTAGQFNVYRQFIKVSSWTPTAVDATVRANETITCGSASGVVVAVNGKTIEVKTITGALFTGSGTITGGTSGVTAAQASVTTQLEDWVGRPIFSHISGITSSGKLVMVASMTSTTITTVDEMLTGTTAFIPFTGIDEAANAMDIVPIYSSFAAWVAPKIQIATTASVALAANQGVTVVTVGSGSNAVAMTLPDVNTCHEHQTFVFVCYNVTNAITITAYAAAQTLDGVNIVATPDNRLNVDGETVIIRRAGNVWITQ